MYFNEETLEESFKTLFKNEGYKCNLGEEITSRKVNEVLIKEDLRKFLNNHYNLTTKEVNSIILKIENFSNENLYDSNKKFIELLSEGFLFKRENSKDKDLLIKLIDYKQIDSNIYRFVNQVQIKEYDILRIPDSIVYINGLPLVVLEFKSAIKEDTTIFDAYKQINTRYVRDIPSLFKYNAFNVISDGVNNKYGSIFTDYEFYFGWRMKDGESKEVDGIDSAFSMVMGLFNKKTILDIIKNFIYFPDADNKETKMISRYSQYYASQKLLKNIKINIRPQGEGKGGTYFGATGCGKSLTMVFLTRLLMKDLELKNPTIVLISDRQFLDKQLSELFTNSKNFIGDNNIRTIESRKDLKESLTKIPSGGVFLTTIQKFSEDFNLLSDRNNIICISDEAHRSQVNLDSKLVVSETKGVQTKYGFAKYLHDSLPNATYVGFTGTPIDKTLEVFGPVIDKYTMKQAVDDGVTVNLVYNGRAADLTLNKIKVKDIDEYYEKCGDEGANKYQIEASQKEVAKMNRLIGDKDRLCEVAKDFINLYEERVNENATVKGKAIFVCSSRHIAYKFYKIILKLRPEWGEHKYPDEKLTDNQKRDIKKMPKVRMVMTRSKDDEKELFDLLGTKEDREEYARQFKDENSNFKIAIVRDMWLTGFDIPCLDTICIDKPIKEHTLIQTISRVNRKYENKDKGLIVDYIGIKKYVNEALRKYDNFDDTVFEDVDEAVKLVKDELNVLNKMFYNFDSSKFFKEDPLERLTCLNNAVEYIQATEDLEKRFMHSVKRLKTAYNLCSYDKNIKTKDKELINFYLGIRSVLFKLTKGEAPDASQMNKVASDLLEQAIDSTGVEEIINVEGEVPTTDLLSDEYLRRINKIKQQNTKIRILEKLIKQSITKYSKVNKLKGDIFSERLEKIMTQYNNRTENKEFAENVITDVMTQLVTLINDFKTDQQSHKDKNIDFEEKAFYDILQIVAQENGFEYPEAKLIYLSKKLKETVSEITKYVDWDVRDDINAELKADIIVLLGDNGYPPELNNEIFTEVFNQAKNYRKNL